MTVDSSAATIPEAAPQNGVPRNIATVAKPATSAPTTYLQIAATKADTPNPIGRPAYQKPGTKRVQKETLHAAATPSGPQGRATRNKQAVVAN